MTEEDLRDDIRLYGIECKIADAFCAYRGICNDVIDLLREMFPDEEELIIDVLFQFADGVVVCYDKGDGFPSNIPLDYFIKGVRK